MRHPQKQSELDQLVEIAKGCRSYLEIGAKHGITTNQIARAMPWGSTVTVVDWPGKVWGAEDTEPELKRVLDDLHRDGYAATLFLGDSQHADIISRVCNLGPFDLILIDADHRYEGVKADWEAYGPMGKAVAFHDIAAVMTPDDSPHVEKMQVGRLWNEIKGSFRHAEFIDPKGTQMGIGVVWR